MQSRALRIQWLISLAAIVLLSGPATAKPAVEVPPDPLKSVMWQAMVERYFSQGPIVFDSRVKVMLPESAENQFFVPVTIDASALNDVQEIVVLTDLNPIAHVLTYKPTRALPFIGLRVKVEQTTPVRAGVRTADGVWHMGGAIVQAAGGGCSAPAAAHADKNWSRTLGQTRVLVNRTSIAQSASAEKSADAARLTLRMRHPMDTGLAFGYAAFYMNRIQVRNADNEVLAMVQLSEPVSENPTLTIMPRVGKTAQTLQVDARDNDGNEFGYSVAVPGSDQTN